MLENARADALRALKEAGLSLAECIRAFSVDNGHPSVIAARRMAAETMPTEDGLEIDDATCISEGEDGDWVLAWVLVPKDAEA